MLRDGTGACDTETMPDPAEQFRRAIADGRLIPMPGGQRDLTADLHGRPTTPGNARDRRYFEEHPTELTYERKPVEHEWCTHPETGETACALDGGVFVIPPDRVVVAVMGPGLRSRQPKYDG